MNSSDFPHLGTFVIEKSWSKIFRRVLVKFRRYQTSPLIWHFKNEIKKYFLKVKNNLKSIWTCCKGRNPKRSKSNSKVLELKLRSRFHTFSLTNAVTKVQWHNNVGIFGLVRILVKIWKTQILRCSEFSIFHRSTG